MRKKLLKRHFTMKDASLTQKADSMLLSANEDLAELSDYGVTPQWLQTVKEQRDEFSKAPTDKEAEGDIIEIFNVKKEIRNELMTMVRANNKRLKNKSEQYMKAFLEGFVENPARLTDDDLRRDALSQSRALQQYLTELAEEGVTQLVIDKLKAHAKLFDDAILETFIVRGDRLIHRETRIEKGNALYASMKTISLYGLSAFTVKEPARAKSYYLTEYTKPKTFSVMFHLKKAEKTEIIFNDLPKETRMTLSHLGGDKICLWFGNAENQATVWELTSKMRLLKKLEEWGYSKTENNILHIENTSAKRPCKIRLRLPVEVRENVISNQ